MARSNIQKMTVCIEPDGGQITVVGRTAWMLKNLIEVGPAGLTSIERPAPRISHYVFELRKAGLIVQTIDEKHSGPYAGYHARYVLRSPVRVLKEEGAADV